MIDFPLNPVAGDIIKLANITFKFDGVAWFGNPANSAIVDAPMDGVLYGRQNGAWVLVPAGGGGGGVTYPLLAPNGNSAAPSFAWESAPNTGWYQKNANAAAYSFGGNDIQVLSSGGGDYTELALGPEVSGSSQITLYDKNRNDPTGNSLTINVGQNGVISFNSYSPMFTDYSMSFSAPGFTFNGPASVLGALDTGGQNTIRYSGPTIQFVNTGTTNPTSIIASDDAGNNFWFMNIDNGGATHDFVLYRNPDGGSPIPAVTIARASGELTFGARVAPVGYSSKPGLNGAVGGNTWNIEYNNVSGRAHLWVDVTDFGYFLTSVSPTAQDYDIVDVANKLQTRVTHLETQLAAVAAALEALK